MINVFKVLALEPERIRLTWISASEGKRYIEVVNEFSDFIQKLGPNKAKTIAHL